MRATRFTLAIALVAAGVSAPALARDALPQAVQQALVLKDGSTLYVFKDGKMAKQDRYGRAAYLKQGQMLELAEGRNVPAVGNEVARLDGLLNDGHRN
jgi:predicted lipoprotein with Yx(FWY)xxD motif